MVEQCQNCFYSRANDSSSVSCCRYPPTITQVNGPQVTTFFPLLRLEAWCGEWRQQVNERYDTKTVSHLQSTMTAKPRRKS